MDTTRPSVTTQNGGKIAVGSIYCIGRNYAEHARELGNAVPAEPVVFLKSTGCLRPIEAGPLAFPDETFHHEAELVLLVGQTLPLGAKGDLTGALAAAALGLDLTRREVQSALKSKGLPWTTAKSFAGAAVVGTFMPLVGVDLTTLRFSLEINGVEKQAGTTADMLFPVATILSYLTTLAPLYPGDLIFTGTPPGVGPIKRGDRFVLRAPALGIDQSGVL